MSCENKVLYRHTTKAFAAAAAMGDTYLRPYLCERHQALHLGHVFLLKRYASWQAAMQASGQLVQQEGVGRRMRIYKDRNAVVRPWRLTWAFRSTSDAHQEEADSLLRWTSG